MRTLAALAVIGLAAGAMWLSFELLARSAPRRVVWP